MLQYTTVTSPFGPIALVGDTKIRRIMLSSAECPATMAVRRLYPEAVNDASPLLDTLAGLIARLLDGEAVPFSTDVLALETCPPFQQRVLRAEYAIPRGSVSTYGRIAAHLGVAGGARAVGTALARNPFPLAIPCHRAIRADGSLGGFQGGLEMKKALLAMEGITVGDDAFVEKPRWYY